MQRGSRPPKGKAGLAKRDRDRAPARFRSVQQFSSFYSQLVLKPGPHYCPEVFFMAIRVDLLPDGKTWAYTMPPLGSKTNPPACCREATERLGSCYPPWVRLLKYKGQAVAWPQPPIGFRGNLRQLIWRPLRVGRVTLTLIIKADKGGRVRMLKLRLQALLPAPPSELSPLQMRLEEQGGIRRIVAPPAEKEEEGVEPIEPCGIDDYSDGGTDDDVPW
jgi:hypothetical protein